MTPTDPVGKIYAAAQAFGLTLDPIAPITEPALGALHLTARLLQDLTGLSPQP